MTRPIPAGFHSITPHLSVADAAAAIEFYRAAFGAEELCRMPGPGGQGVMHAEIRIGDSVLMLNDEFPEHGMPGPTKLGGTPVTIQLYVEDADAVFGQALTAGATATMPLQDMFWGDRYGQLVDPYGHRWSIATHIEDLEPEQIAERSAAAFANCAES